MSPRRGQSGIALIGALAITGALMPLVARLHYEVAVETVLSRRSAARAQALYSAEAGVALALDALSRGLDPSVLQHGPDGVAGTADDGRFPFAPGEPGGFPNSDYEIEVAVVAASASQVELIASATGPRDAARAVRATIEFAPASGGPARRIAWTELP